MIDKFKSEQLKKESLLLKIENNSKILDTLNKKKDLLQQKRTDLIEDLNHFELKWKSTLNDYDDLSNVLNTKRIKNELKYPSFFYCQICSVISNSYYLFFLIIAYINKTEKSQGYDKQAVQTCKSVFQLLCK